MAIRRDNDLDAGPRRGPRLVHRSACLSRPTGIGSRISGAGGDVTFDAEYVRRLIAADPTVERHFVEYFEPLISIKLRRRLGGSEDVRDLRQETFARVFAALRTGNGIRHPERIGGFVAATCDNLLREHWRTRRKHPEAPQPAAEAADDCDGSDSMLVREELVEQVRSIVAALPERDRDLLRAVFLEDRDRDEVCLQFGINRDYLRVLLHRAKDRFRVGYRAAMIARVKARSDDTDDAARRTSAE